MGKVGSLKYLPQMRFGWEIACCSEPLQREVLANQALPG